MKWDLNYLFNQGHENDHKYTIREDASLALEDFDKQIREAGLEVPTQPPPEMQDSRSFDDVKPSGLIREGIVNSLHSSALSKKCSLSVINLLYRSLAVCCLVNSPVYSIYLCCIIRAACRYI